MKLTSTPVWEWHNWFAWYPVEVGGVRVWLHTVQRQGECASYAAMYGRNWKYREIPT